MRNYLPSMFPRLRKTGMPFLKFGKQCRLTVVAALLVSFAAPAFAGSEVMISQLHGTDSNGADFTPGTPNPRNSAAPLCPCASTALTRTIPQIQGSGAASQFDGAAVTTEGVVTLKLSTGFYLQDAGGDGNSATSDGIFVYTGSTASSVKAGDKVQVSATVTEFKAGDAARPITQLASVTALIVQSSGHSVTPTVISMPLASANDMERYEGMLVRFSTPLTVSQNYFLGRYGQLTLSAGRLEQPANRYAAGSPAAHAAALANAAATIVLDDGAATQHPNPIPYIGADHTVRAGDTVADLTGVIDFGLVTASNPGPTGYKLQPTVSPVFSRANPRTAAPLIAPGNIKAASFNVLNFFTTFPDGNTADGLSGQGCALGSTTLKSNCRGADNAAEFKRQRDKIVAAMLAIGADVFGLMEIQNNGDKAASNLVDGLNAVAGAGSYATVPAPSAAGATGSDAIRVAMIYKPAKLTLAGASISDTDPVNSRPPLAQTFIAANGEKFSLIVNHMKSKGSCPTDGSANTDQGDGQGCWNALRIAQAQRLAAAFIPQVQAAAQDSDVLVIGDLNSYGAEDPIHTLTAAGLVNQIERFVRPAGLPYSYVFDGQAGYLDHALASASLDRQIAGVSEWHINADEPAVIDYNTEFKPQDLYSATPYRASDHDPVVISLNLQAGLSDVTARMKTSQSGLKRNPATHAFDGKFTITNKGSAAIAGPFQVEFRNLPERVKLVNAAGTHDGAPYLTAKVASLAPDQSMSVALSFSKQPKRQYAVRIYSGDF